MSMKAFINGEWKDIAQGGGGSGIPVGTFVDFGGTEAPNGFLVRNGAELLIETYPALYAAIGTTYGGDGVTTFKLPNSIGKYIRGGLSEEVGTELEAGLPNITGSINSVYWSMRKSGDTSGSIQVTKNYGTNYCGVSVDRDFTSDGFDIDASRSSDIYGNSDTVTPPSLVALPCIKAFDTIAETAEVTTENLAQEIVELRAELERSKGEAVVSTIIYPNGGSAESPANVTINQRIVMDNPYPGYFVSCEAQIKVSNKWGKTGFVYQLNSSGFGVSAGQILNDDKIIIQTGGSALVSVGRNGGTILQLSDAITTAPCRVIVTRLGKMPD